MKKLFVLLVSILPFASIGQVYDAMTFYVNDWIEYSVAIKTNVELVDNQIIKVHIDGYDDSRNSSIILDVSWHSEGEEFANVNAASSGGYAPLIYLGKEDGKVQIYLLGEFYFTRFSVTAFSEGLDEQPDYFRDWSVEDSDPSSQINSGNGVAVLYNNHFRDHVAVDGQLTANTINANEGISTPDITSEGGWVGNLYSNTIQSEYVKATGKMAIGTNNLKEALQVNGGIVSTGTNQGFKFNCYNNSGNKFFAQGYAGAFTLDTLGTLVFANTTNSGNANDSANLNNVFVINKEGKVGIGNPNPQVSLAVNGEVNAKKVKVTLTGWPDYVFEDKYNLLSIDSLKNFIKKNKHLPEVPSVSEVDENGLDVGSNQSILLKKIEELTLYLIEANESIKRLEKKVANQQIQLDELKKEDVISF